MGYKGKRPSVRLKEMGVSGGDSNAAYCELARLVGIKPENEGPLKQTYLNDPTGRFALARVGASKLAEYVRGILQGYEIDNLGKSAPTRQGVLSQYPAGEELRALMERDAEILQAVEGSTVHLVKAVHRKKAAEENRLVGKDGELDYHGAI